MDCFQIFLTLWSVWEKLETGKWELSRSGCGIILAHMFGLQGLFYILTGQFTWQFLVFQTALVYTGAVGVSAGAHRLWSHRSYKAKLPLRILLMLSETLIGHGSVYTWARDHRLHHKYSETNADPHNIKRGFFFSHIGWMLIKEHPEVAEKEKLIDFTDLNTDPVVAFQHKYYRIFEFILCHAIPILLPYYLWLPSLHKCFCINCFRFVFTIHVGSLGNSVAHTWTRKPYERNIGPADVTWLSLLIVGEGWHNFHHIFPWDYRSTDEGLYFCNLTSMFIDLMARIGWAYDLKTVPDLVIRKRAERTGDGSYTHVPTKWHDNGLERNFNENANALCENAKAEDCNLSGKEVVSSEESDLIGIPPAPWGWGDEDISEEKISHTIITHQCIKSK